ncbi:50S ribosomal protein L28 [candidate division TA06 bacterium]|nr:50S ribosomal protein L28 [candidate division TA06 bacterium]
MAKQCFYCGKRGQFGSNISHAHNVTKRRWQPNLQRVKAVIEGETKKVYSCTDCIRSGRVTKKAS